MSGLPKTHGWAVGLMAVAVFVLIGSLFRSPPRTSNHRNVAYGKQVVYGLRLWAEDHEQIPQSSPEALLFPKYCDFEEVLFWVDPDSREQIPWLLNPNLPGDSFSGNRVPILAQPRSWKGKRIVVYTDSTVEEFAEEDFQWPP